MKAAVLEALGKPLVVRERDVPQLRAGEVLVDVKAAPVLPYAAQVFGGERTYGLELPIVPGCGAIGKVRAKGSDATQLKTGDWVFCDPVVRSRDNLVSPDIALQGWDSRGDGGRQLQSYFHDGPFAEVMSVPTENCIPLGEINPTEAAMWCQMATLVIPYGGLSKIRFCAGETLLVSGGSGYFGSATVMVALAMGASKVVAVGRNNEVLNGLVNRFGSRVKTVTMRGVEHDDSALMKQAADGAIDCVLDFLPPNAPASAVRTAAMTVRQNGRVMLMGGVGLEGGAELSLPYPWFMLNNVSVHGQWMYERADAYRFARIMQSGMIDMSIFQIKSFGLGDINQAIAHAANSAGAFKMTVIEPFS